jgi:hypothetical protein
MSNAVEVWVHMHWLFFVHIQSLIICLLRFQAAIDEGNIPNAKVELKAASTLLLASGSAMTLAGGFPREAYETEVRGLMVPPNVAVENFSGLLSADHADLIKLWKQLTPYFKNLPPELESEQHNFKAAYLELAAGHRAVCDKFGGGDAPSLRSQTTALDELDKFEKSRLKLIDPVRKPAP